jgi:sulfite exporter TauE/SafE
MIWQGFLLGLSTGVFCLGYCAPVFVPYVLAEARPRLGMNLGLVGQFLLGRLAAYTLFGLAAGYLGVWVGGSLPRWVIALSLVVLSLLLILYALAQSLPRPGLCRFVRGHSARMPLVLGFLTGINPCPPFGINPCPPFLLATASVFEGADPLGGVLLFVAFFLGTSLYMFPLTFVGLLSRYEQIREVARLTAIIVGVVFLLMGISYLLP